jgi:hypothetical protein
MATFRICVRGYYHEVGDSLLNGLLTHGQVLSRIVLGYTAAEALCRIWNLAGMAELADAADLKWDNWSTKRAKQTPG